MKNSEILEKVLEGYDKPGSRFLCDRIYFAVKPLTPNEHQKVRKLTGWIQKHLEGEFSVREWLEKYHHIVVFDASSYRNPELREYRRLWLINMIEYWKHHEASQDN